MKLDFGVISPQEWGLAVVVGPPETALDGLGVSLAVLEARARAATYKWLSGQFDEASGAFCDDSPR